MRSRIATIVTALALIAGAGGAVALGESGSHGGPLGGAASGQYCNGKKCPVPPKHNCGKHHNQKCPAHKPKPKPSGSKRHKHGPSKPKPKSQKKTPKTHWANCSLTQQGNVLVAYCP
jgi:RNA recognition motif-containing protein